MRDIPKQSKVLVLGLECARSVEAYRNNLVDAYGCEFWVDHPYVYGEKLVEVNFPTDYFDVIVIQEHSEGIIEEAYEEAYRILKPIDKNGLCILNSPMEEVGSSVFEKFSIEADGSMRKPVQSRPRILLPPGIGDIYWTLVKMESFLKRENLGLPDIFTVSYKDRHNGYNRGFPFLEMFPFLHATWKSIENNDGDQRIWNEAYSEKGRTIFKDVCGYDYFMAYNGHINNGVELENADDLECNWIPRRFVSLREEKDKKYFQSKYGDYIIFHFSFGGTYLSCEEEFSVDRIIDSIRKVSDSLGATPILVGGGWNKGDVGIDRILKNTKCVDMVGKTTVEEVFGLIRGSKMIVGYPSGLAMVSPMLGTKALTLWNDYYCEETFWNVVPPSTRKKLYFVENTKELTVDVFVKRILEIYNAN